VELLRLVSQLFNGLIYAKHSENHLVEPAFFPFLVGFKTLHDIVGVDLLKNLGERLTRCQIEVNQVLELYLLFVLFL
jgi:hypothetical protein